jgi:hypothetical protein
MAREQTLRPIASHVASRRGQDATKALRSGTWRRQTYRLPRDKARGARTPVGGNDQRPSLGLLVMALAVLRQPLTRDESVLVTVAFAAMLGSSAALSQAEAETEVAPSQPVETVPTAPPTPPRVVPDEPAASTPPVVAPNESAPGSQFSSQFVRDRRSSAANRGSHVRSDRIPGAGSNSFLSSRSSTEATFCGDADRRERTRHPGDGGGCPGW